MIIDYVVVRSVDEALAILVNYPDQARILAGGTDSFSQLDRAERKVVAVDISRARELSRVDRNSHCIEIGAAATLSHLLRIPWLVEEFPALIEAISKVGSPQIRNQGTLLGNILTGRAAANARLCVTSVGALLEVRGPKHERRIGIENDGLGYSSYKLKNDEIAVSLVIPLEPSTRASAYRCFTPRKGFAYASASVSASLSVNEGKIEGANVVASPILPASAKLDMKPCNTCAGSCRICEVKHLPELEQDLVGRPAKEKEIDHVCSAFDWQAIPMRNSLINGISDYRRHLLRVLSKEALTTALYRANTVNKVD
jgi:carbon-monoxide dehydrogenase medium subunit